MKRELSDIFTSMLFAVLSAAIVILIATFCMGILR